MLRDAAQAAIDQGDVKVAVRWLARASEEPPTAADQADVFDELGCVQILAGEATDAVASLTAALEFTGDDPARALRRGLLLSARFSADGHVDRVTLSFTVVPAPTPTTTPTATPSDGPSATPSAARTPGPSPTPVPTPAPSDSGATGGDVVVPIIAAVVILGGLGVYLLRRRSASG